jgi:hypothetical protein
MLGLLGLSGCETVPSSGTPFQPVAVESPPAAGSLASAAIGETESEEPRLRLSFDGTTTKVESGPADLVEQQKVKDAAGGDGVADASKPSEPGALDGLLAAAQGAPAEPHASGPTPTGSSLPPPTTTAPPVTDPGQVGRWPVRLVKTIPDAQPPRAVLGLPNGKEIVVTPGTMIPEEGLVVVAIGPSRVHLSQVESQGDHASITSFTLDAMY